MEAKSGIERLLGPDVDLMRMQSGRQRKLIEAMSTADVDALVLLDPLNIEYVGGDSSGDLFANEGTATLALFTAAGEVHTFSVPAKALRTDEVTVDTLLDDTWTAPTRRIADLLESAGGRRIALDCPSLGCLMALQQALGHPRRIRVVDSGASIVTRARVTKTPEEVECLRRAQIVLEQSNMEAVRVLEPGVVSDDLSKAMAEFIADLDPSAEVIPVPGEETAGASVPCIWHVASASPRNAAGEPSFPFPPLPSGPFKKGDVIWTDSTLRYHGLEADYGSTWVVGARPDAHLRDQRERWYELRDRVAGVLRPGGTAADVIETLMSRLDRPPWLSHVYPMHGIGVGAAEYPIIGADPEGWIIRSLQPWPQLVSLPRNEELVLEPGMVLVVEPVIWDEGNDRAGYRAETTYVITESGAEPLTQDPYPGFD